MSVSRSEPRSIPWTLLLLGILALVDLRIELLLLLDHFTWTSLMAIPLAHPLAIAVLILLPGLWSRCR
jgi:hypothetical protein